MVLMDQLTQVAQQVQNNAPDPAQAMHVGLTIARQQQELQKDAQLMDQQKEEWEQKKQQLLVETTMKAINAATPAESKVYQKRSVDLATQFKIADYNPYITTLIRENEDQKSQVNQILQNINWDDPNSASKAHTAVMGVFKSPAESYGSFLTEASKQQTELQRAKESANATLGKLSLSDINSRVSKATAVPGALDRFAQEFPGEAQLVGASDLTKQSIIRNPNSAGEQSLLAAINHFSTYASNLTGQQQQFKNWTAENRVQLAWSRDTRQQKRLELSKSLAVQGVVSKLQSDPLATDLKRQLNAADKIMKMADDPRGINPTQLDDLAIQLGNVAAGAKGQTTVSLQKTFKINGVEQTAAKWLNFWESNPDAAFANKESVVALKRMTSELKPIVQQQYAERVKVPIQAAVNVSGIMRPEQGQDTLDYLSHPENYGYADNPFAKIPVGAKQQKIAPIAKVTSQVLNGVKVSADSLSKKITIGGITQPVSTFLSDPRYSALSSDAKAEINKRILRQIGTVNAGKGQ